MITTVVIIMAQVWMCSPIQSFLPLRCLGFLRISLLKYQILSDQRLSWRFSAGLAHPWCSILLYGQPSVVVLQWAYTVAKRTMSLNPAPWEWLIWAEHCLEIPWNFCPSLLFGIGSGQAFRPPQWKHLDVLENTTLPNPSILPFRPGESGNSGIIDYSSPSKANV